MSFNGRNGRKGVNFNRSTRPLLRFWATWVFLKDTFDLFLLLSVHNSVKNTNQACLTSSLVDQLNTFLTMLRATGHISPVLNIKQFDWELFHMRDDLVNLSDKLLQELCVLRDDNICAVQFGFFWQRCEYSEKLFLVER